MKDILNRLTEIRELMKKGVQFERATPADLSLSDLGSANPDCHLKFIVSKGACVHV